MVGMKYALLLLVASCVLAQPEPELDVLYMHNQESCSEPSSESKYPFCNWHYLVYAPRIFRAGIDEKVLLSTSNIDFDVTFTTTFKSGRNFKVSSSNVVKPGVLTEAILKIPHNAPSSGYIEVSGIADVPKGTNGIEQDSGWSFYNKTSTIQVHRTSSQVYIQTDRPIYKPGETIRIRVLSVDSNLKAVTGVISKMAVLNPSRTTMRQWRNVKLQGGFASFKLKLSIKPVLGLWRVEATVKGKRKTIYIKVEKYVLPKFQVTIKPPSYIANGEAKADGEFCAKYSYGKDVSGVLRAKICAYFPRYWNYRSYSYSSDKEICDNIVKKISGCQPFEMDLKFFKINDYRGYRRPSFTFEASVKEGATGITLNATKVDMTVHKNNVELTFKGTPDIFKPALPFEAWVYAKRPDGSPVDSIDVKIRVRNGNYRSVHKEVIKIRGGKGKVNLPKVPLQTKRLRFVATYQPKSFPQRRARSSVPYTGGRSSSVNAYHTANAWYSPSHSYIAITKEDKVYKPGTDAKFTVKYTTYGDEKVKRNVFYALMCKGTVALSGVVPTEFAAATENSRPKRSVDEDGDEIPPFADDDDDDDVAPEDDTVTTDIKTPKMTTAEMTTPGMTTPEMTTSEMTTPEMTTPEMTTPEMTTPEMTTPEMTTSEMTTAETTTESPPATTTTAPPPLRLFTHEEIWYTRPRGPATRAPLPDDLSVGSFDFGFRVTADMTPSCRMLVYYIKHRETVADSIVVQTGNSFANEVSMKFNQKQVFPGTKVNLTLKASPGSRFAISAVDKSVHFLREANDLKSGQVLDVLKRLDIGPGYISDYDRCKSRHWYYYYSESKYVDSQKAFNDNGMTFLSNMFIDTRPCEKEEYYALPMILEESLATAAPVVAETAAPVELDNQGTRAVEGTAQERLNSGSVPKSKPKPKVRSEFPETWLWTEEKFDNKTGEKVVEVTVPDTITTWYASGFAVSDKTGLGVSQPAEIRGFKEVFLSMNLPYSVIRGEIVTLPIVIFNYMPDCLHIMISMKDDPKNFRSLTRSYADFCICGGQSATVMFKIIPRTIGRINIEASAETLSTNTCPKQLKFDPNSYVDIVRRKVLVEPEGVEKEYTFNSLVCPKEEKSVAEKVKLSIPDKVVPGSVFAELRVIGDLMGPSLSNIDSLLKMPYGCGEQNMLNFAPNIFIMQYLKATNQLTEEIRTKAEGYTLQGYQRQLSYKHPDGSYSAFGERDKVGSMWLTAFVLKSFAQARPFIQIDGSVLNSAKRWIIRKQSRDGCFPTIGTLHNKAMKGGVSGPVALTGYVIVALLEADMNAESPHIRVAIDKCLKPSLKDVNDSYSLAILAYAMAKAGRTNEYQYLLKKLNSMAIKESGMRHWEEPTKKEKKRDDWFYSPYHQARSADIEMTAYGLLSMIPDQDQNKALASIDIVKWLSQQRNSLGGWSSTQDTVLAMQALAQYAEIVYGGDVDMKIDVSTEGLQHQFAVSSSNNLVLQRLQIPSKFPSVLKTFATGNGCALLSASVKYNVQQIQQVAAFSLTVDVSPVKSKKKLKHGRCRSQMMTICAKWQRKGDSNMAIIAVKMLSGFRPVIPTLDKAVEKNSLLKEYEKKGKEWIFYYSRINDVCLSFVVKQENIVEGIKPASVTVYDYYDTDLSAITKYKVTSKMCK